MRPLKPGQAFCTACGFAASAYVAQTHHLLPGTLLAGRYAVGKVLGEGGFGITYVGIDTRLKRKIAIKEFYMNGFVSRYNTYSTQVQVSVGESTEIFQKNRDRFLEEAQVLASFSEEPGIVGVHDYFLENGTAYIVMEFLDGMTLKAYLQQGSRLTWENTRRIFQPVLSSLNEIHKHGIIHRDISPDNIMLTKRGQVKLLDFGAAREFSSGGGKSLSVILKPGYAPEEQYRTKGEQGPWTDVYALCATMYRCLTGITPDETMERLVDDRLRPPAELCDCPKSVSDVLMHGLAVFQRNRIQTVEILMKALASAELQPAPPPVVPASREEATVYAGAAPAPNAAPPAESVQSRATIPPVRTAPPAAVSSQPIRTVPPTVAPSQPVRTVPPTVAPSQPAPSESPQTQKKRTGTALLVALLVLAVGLGAWLTIRALTNSITSQLGSSPQAESERSEEKVSDTDEEEALMTDKDSSADTVGNTAVTVGYSGDGLGYVNNWTNLVAIDAGEIHTVGLHEDGTVSAIGNRGSGQCDVTGWSDIVAISAGDYYTVGLRSDGTVLSVGGNYYGQCSVENWTNITAISAGCYHTLGLNANGTVAAVGENTDGQCNTNQWTDIISVAAGFSHSVGLRSDGTVVAVGNNANGECNVGDWTDIVAIAAGYHRTVGLKADGTVVAVGSNSDGECNVDGWTDIIAVSTGKSHTVGLKSDGTVVAVGSNSSGQCDVEAWSDIEFISTGNYHTVALKK